MSDGPDLVSVPDFVLQDARRAFDVLRGGGIAVLPMDVGYSLIGGSTPALERIFSTKGRAPSKLNAMLGNQPIARELFNIGTRAREVLEAVTLGYGLPLGAVAPCDFDHPLLRSLDTKGRQMSTRDGTVCMLINAGPFHEALCELSHRHAHPLIGSSANRSLQGTKFRVRDIEPEVVQIADIVIDHGLRKYHHYGASSTLLDLESLEVHRHGACFDLIADVVERHFGVTLPGQAG